jgi:asparagine synthetase A
MKRAWKSTVKCLGMMNGIVAASTRGQAKFKNWRSANEVGYHIRFGDVHVVRCPEFDTWAEVDSSGSVWDEDCLRRNLNMEAT